MKNIIILDEIPNHKATFLIGVLIGMGLSYKIAPKSPMYRLLREKKRGRYHELGLARDPEKADFQKDSCRVFLLGGNVEDIKINVL